MSAVFKTSEIHANSFICPLVVLPHLHKLALANNSQAVESKRIDIATQLFEAYSALSCCCILLELLFDCHIVLYYCLCVMSLWGLIWGPNASCVISM